MKGVFSSNSNRTRVLLSLVFLLTAMVLAMPAKAQVEKIDPEVQEAAKNQEQIKVIVYLTDQPSFEISQQEKAVHLPAVNQLSDQIQLLMEPFQLNNVVPAPVEQQRRALRVEQEQRLEEMRRAIYARLEPRVQPQQDRMVQFVENQLNGTVHARIFLVNALGVEIPSATLDRLAQQPDVRWLILDDEGQAELNISAQAIDATYIWNNKGYDGDGEPPGDTDVAVVDSGIFMNHNAFGPLSGKPNHRGPQRGFRIGGLPTDIVDTYGHGTAIAGIIASNNSTYRGISHGIDKLISAKVMKENSGPDKSKVMEAIEWAVRGLPNDSPQNTELAEIVNTSFGFDEVRLESSDYTPLAQFFDAVVDDLWVPITKSAGNTAGPDGSISVPAEAYNIFTVGNIEDKNTVTRADDSIRFTSSWGPTKNGRNKPDVCAPGTKIKTTLTNGSYGHNLVIGDEITGTSFAAPHVAGAIALLMDFWIPNPLIIKAILVNTASDEIAADDPDDWDKKYGWGYITLMQAYNKRWNYHYIVGAQEDENYYFKGTMYPNQTATIVWHSHVDYVNGMGPGAVKPLSNLDLVLYDYTDQQQGAQLDISNSPIDNVEQVEYRGSGSKEVLIEVRIPEVHSSVSSEDFVLHIDALSTFTEIASPAPPILSVADSESSDTIDDELGQNFPNPFNPETWIPYAIREEASVTVQIFNANGQQVRELSLGQKTPGRYFSKENAAYWDGRNNAGEQVATGVYFYYIKAGDFQATRKMILSK
jgi:serine protease AprX